VKLDTRTFNISIILYSSRHRSFHPWIPYVDNFKHQNICISVSMVLRERMASLELRYRIKSHKRRGIYQLHSEGYDTGIIRGP
jgi:hypothetical protein